MDAAIVSIIRAAIRIMEAFSRLTASGVRAAVVFLGYPVRWKHGNPFQRAIHEHTGQQIPPLWEAQDASQWALGCGFDRWAFARSLTQKGAR